MPGRFAGLMREPSQVEPLRASVRRGGEIRRPVSVTPLRRSSLRAAA